MTSITEWIDAAQKRCDEATEGPWVAFGTNIGAVVSECTCGLSRSPYGHEPACGVEGPIADASEPDAIFIAAARTDLPAALAALRAVEGEHLPTSDWMWCTCTLPWPCVTRTAIATALGVAP